MPRRLQAAAVVAALLSACTSGSSVERTPPVTSAATPVIRPSAAPAGCTGAPRATCGTVDVPFDRADPSAGTIRIGYELHPHTDRAAEPLEPIVATEGGPGYATTASRGSYLQLFRPLLDRHDLLLVDNRGTGTSGAVRCPGLQRLTFADYSDSPGVWLRAVGECGRRLGAASDLYGTANAADDLADVLDALRIDRVDLYGDSYGTFFAQTFAVRHPDRLRALVLDAAYSVEGYDPWFRDTNRAIVDAFRAACGRDAGCRAIGGDPIDRLELLLDRVRSAPIVGRAHDADGTAGRVTVDARMLADVTWSAAGSPTIYRELDASIRAAMRAGDPDLAPLLRLVRENLDPGDSGDPREYSQGLADAVTCNDYIQLYDMTAPPATRSEQYRRAVDDLAADEPDSFAPFRVDEWTSSPVEDYDSCTEWPVPDRPSPPLPANHVYPDLPVLVLVGDLDSLTSPEGARAVAGRFPGSTFVEVANSTHVTAIEDPDRCASAIVLRFVMTGGDAGDTSCAGRIAEVRLVDEFARRASDVEAPTEDARTALIALNTAADVVARWWSMYGYDGVGLRGGRFSTRGSRLVSWTLRDVRWVEDVGVGGRMTWDRGTGAIAADLRLRGAVQARVRARWNDRARHGRAVVWLTVGGRHVRLVVPAA